MTQPRRRHYVFAHATLRDVVFQRQGELLGILRNDDAENALQRLWEAVGARLRDPDLLGSRLRLTRSSLTGGVEVWIVWMPAPKGITEAHAIAIVAEPAETQTQEFPGGARMRYFTLEHGMATREGPLTVLCEWRHEAGDRYQHANYGGGPPPEPAGLLEAIRTRLGRP